MARMDASGLVASLPHLEAEIGAAAAQLLGQAANVAVRHARATTKFNDRTRRLRSGIKRRDVGTFQIQVRDDVAYAGFIEDGTRFITPRKFMQDARDEAETQLARSVESGISSAIASAR